jgi:membrane-bound metal-dependent hydrolase YbcI (DUF457 family)
MNTPSHFLMTAALDKLLPRVPIHQQAFLIGSVAPDIPLWILSLGGIVYYHFILGWSLAKAFHLMFDNLYFYNPFWLAFHNLLHAPLLLLLGITLVWRKRRNIGSIYRWLFWFLLACLLHSSVDILTHADDGPLLFFPLNWSVRFHSPISYWDPRYHGREFSRFELGLDSFFILYLLRQPLCRFAQGFKRS